MEYPDAIPESVVIKDTFGSSYKQSQEKFTPSPSPSPSSIVNFSGLALRLIRSLVNMRAGLVWVTH